MAFSECDGHIWSFRHIPPAVYAVPSTGGKINDIPFYGVFRVGRTHVDFPPEITLGYWGGGYFLATAHSSRSI